MIDPLCRSLIVYGINGIRSCGAHGLEAHSQERDQKRRQGRSYENQQAEQNSQVVAALDQLALHYKTVIVLRDVEDLDYQQIAQIVGVPIGTVKSRVHRGRLALRKHLADMIEG